jgi:hypothetical protein
MTSELLWIGIGVTLVAVAIVAMVRARVDHEELGSVSMHWLAEHGDVR